MKTKLMQVALLSCLIIFVIACDPKKGEPRAAAVIDTEQVKKDIQAKENEFAEVYNSGEIRNIGYYADDAVTFSQNKAPLVGKPAIVEFMAAGITASSKGDKITFTTNEVFVSNDGNQVVEIGYFNLADSTNVPINTGNYMVLFEKRNGTYAVVREMSASDMPLEK
jgi:ketosteroid isomerase-like protein